MCQSCANRAKNVLSATRVDVLRSGRSPTERVKLTRRLAPMELPVDSRKHRSTPLRESLILIAPGLRETFRCEKSGFFIIELGLFRPFSLAGCWRVLRFPSSEDCSIRKGSPARRRSMMKKPDFSHRPANAPKRVRAKPALLAGIASFHHAEAASWQESRAFIIDKAFCVMKARVFATWRLSDDESSGFSPRPRGCVMKARVFWQASSAA